MDNHGSRGGTNVVYWDDWTDGEDMRAMWGQPGVRLLWEQRREASGKVTFKMEKVGEKSVPCVSLEELHAAVLILLRRHFSTGSKRLWPTHLAGSEGDAVARAASGWRVKLGRCEERVGAGLMVVLQKSAKWLAKEMGYPAYAADVASGMLCRPFAGLYYGMAYLAWLTTYNGITRSEEFVVRAYHGGPGGWEKESAAVHWSKYLQAKEEVLHMLHGSAMPSLLSTPAPSLSQPVLPSIPSIRDWSPSHLQSGHALVAHPPQLHHHLSLTPAPVSHPSGCSLSNPGSQAPSLPITAGPQATIAAAPQDRLATAPAVSFPPAAFPPGPQGPFPTVPRTPFPQQNSYFQHAPFPQQTPFLQQAPFPSAAQTSFPSPLQSAFPSSSSERSGHFSLSVKWGFKSGRE